MNEPRLSGLSTPIRWALAAVVCVVLGGGSGYWAGSRQTALTPLATSPARAVAENGSASSASSAAQESVLQAPLVATNESSLRWPLWEYELLAGVPARAEALTPPPWRFIGAVMVDGVWRLIVQRQGATEPEYYKKGDRLPGGYTIRDIGQEDVTLLSGGREIVFSYIGSP
jgi:hypothetical protein